jgi:hypothetical protein
MLMLMLLLAMQDAPALPKMTVTPLGGDGFVFTAGPFRMTQRREVETEEARLAGKTCGTREVVWGNRSIEGPIVGDPRPTLTDYRHMFRCVAPDTRAYAPAPKDWRATPADETELRAAFARYYAKFDSGDFEGAYAMFDAHEVADRAEWLANHRDSVTQIGRGTRTVTAVRWAVNPEGMGHPGVYGVVVFDGDYPAMNAVCGRVVLYRRGPGDYEVVNDLLSFLPRGSKPMTPEALVETKRQGCPK